MSLPHCLKLIILLVFIALPASSYAEDTTDTAVPYGQNPAAGNYADINGIKLYYETYGTGAPLVLIHGNGDSISGLKGQIEHFAKSYKVIVADSRGHGKSGLGTDQLTYGQMLDDWNGLLNHLGIKDAAIFGWSDGGILGLKLAISHPDKVSKLAIMGANLRPDDTAVEAWVKPLLDGAVKQVEGMVAQKDTSQNWALQKQLLNLLMTQPHIKTTSLQQIKIPVLVIAGDRDVIRVEHTIEIFQSLENAHLAILPGNTHFAPAVHPAQFNRLLGNFFGKPFTKPTTQEIMEHH